MARTKKELKDQLLADELGQGEGAALEGAELPPDSTGEQEPQAAGSLSDLELLHASSLDPDALPAESESGDAAGIPSQTNFEPPPEPEHAPVDGQAGADAELDGMGALQSGPDESADGRPPDEAMEEPFGGGNVFGGEPLPASQTPPFYMPPQQAGSENAAPAAEPEPAGQPDGVFQGDPENGPVQTDAPAPRAAGCLHRR